MQTHRDPTNNDRNGDSGSAAGLAALIGCACFIASGCAGHNDEQRRDPSAHERAHRMHQEAVREHREGDPSELNGTRAERTSDSAPISSPGSAPLVVDTNVRVPDTSARNELAVQPAPIAPLDEVNNTDTDRQLAARIRKSINADDSLSMNAKNVTIISNAGEVTLRGPVATAAEKSRVETYAQRAAGSTRVNNQLEIAK